MVFPAMDPLSYPYPSRRMALYARRGAVGTSHPLASQAGIRMLEKGGNAVDAAIAAAAVLAVVEPGACGVGGDAFAIVWMKNKLYGLNASGYSPRAASLEALHAAGHTSIPMTGWIPVMVPGAPAGWAALSKRFGSLPFAEVLEPAISYARDGFAVTPALHAAWQAGYLDFSQNLHGDMFDPWFKVFAPQGRAPLPGEIWRNSELAHTLECIAQTHAEDFYRGSVAEKIADFSQKTGGWLAADDLAEYEPEWVDPIRTSYRGYDVWELPPNGHGMIALMALNIFEGFDVDARETGWSYHLQIESLKQAFADGLAYIADPRAMPFTPEQLLSKEYAAARRAQIGETALLPQPGRPDRGGTVYLAAADGEGNMVSFIQSIFTNFSSGICPPGTGLVLQNRGACFRADASHPNCIAPRKRSYHTIIPGFLTKAGEAVGPFGVMGGYMQPQAHMQVILNTIDFHMNPQAALDAPRWQWLEGRKIALEPGAGSDIAAALVRRGHDVQMVFDPTSFGRGQIIWRNSETGVLCAGTEPRTDGMMAVL